MLKSLLQAVPGALANPDSTLQATKEGAKALVSTIKEDPNAALQTLGQNALNFGLKVLAAIVIYVVGAWLIKKIKNVLNKSMERKKTDKAIVTFVSSLVSISLTVLLIVIVIGTLGINTTSLAALLAAGGMAIGMALSGTVQNFAGGIMLIIFKPFKAGDFIEAQGYLGTVTEVNIVSTKLLTVDNRVVVLPNGALSAGTIDNYSQKSVRRLDIDLPFEHGTDVDKLLATIREIVAQDDRVITEPVDEASGPFYAVSDIDKDSVTVKTRVWCKAENYWPLYHDLRRVLYSGLGKAGFRFASNRIEVLNS